jgi:hypothetical protein
MRSQETLPFSVHKLRRLLPKKGGLPPFSLLLLPLLSALSILPPTAFSASPWTLPGGIWKEKEGERQLKINGGNSLRLLNKEGTVLFQWKAEVTGQIRNEYKIVLTPRPATGAEHEKKDEGETESPAAPKDPADPFSGGTLLLLYRDRSTLLLYHFQGNQLISSFEFTR